MEYPEITVDALGKHVMLQVEKGGRSSPKRAFFDTFDDSVENAQATVLEVWVLAAVIFRSKCLEWKLLG